MGKKYYYWAVKGRKTQGARKTTLATSGMGARPKIKTENIYRRYGWKDIEVVKVWYNPKRIR